jgi:NADP-dependent aldehyde dehydrogenase
MRLRQIPLGPVAVFGASNFPLAFSTAGGDTASALAAGCPVVVKAHPAHPGAALLAGRAIMEAAAELQMPEGVFSLVQGPSNAIGAALVSDPRIKAVGFTGSRAGGLALVGLAAKRPEPIPVFAEMSSVNPVVLLPAALESGAEGLAKGYVGSLTLGAGQFCTNPGLVFAIAGPDLDRFTHAAAASLNAVAPQTMLHAGIARHFRDSLKAVEAIDGVNVAARGLPGAPAVGVAALLTATASQFIKSPAMAQEVFGPSSLIVACADAVALSACLRALEGQLTVTVHMTDADLAEAQRLLPLLERKAGRILVNGWPTGVEVCRAMVHGGPFPATSDSRFTSVGAKAIERFLRPVCYQAFPDALLPQALQDANPLGLPRLAFDFPAEPFAELKEGRKQGLHALSPDR